MFSFLGKNRSTRRTRSASAARTTATKSRRRRLCGWEQLEERSMLAISVVSSVNGVFGNNTSYDPSLSADGRYVAFWSYADNLVSGDTNGTADIFLKDAQSGALTRISTDSNGNQGEGNSVSPSLSADGRYVVFASTSSNLVNSDTNGKQDIFRKDTVSGAITLVSIDGNGNQGNGHSSIPAVSADGRYVVFRSDASNLVSGDTNVGTDIFLKDMLTNALIRVSTDSNGNQSYFGSDDNPSISADGRYVVFESSASNLVSGDTNGAFDIFRKDTQSNELIRLSTDSNGNQGNSNSGGVSLSADGHYVVFYSAASNLVSGDTNGTYDIFRKDTLSGAITRLSTDISGNQGNDDSYGSSLSSDGRYVVFSSDASNLVSGDTNGKTDIFLKDTVSNAISRLSTDGNGNQGNNDSYGSSLSSDGRYVVFSSVSSNFVSGDTNGTYDVFLVDTLASPPAVTSPTQVNVTSNSAILGGTVTTDNGATITERGILVSKTSVNNNPQLNGTGVTKLTATGTTGVFTVAATSLDPVTGYSYVAFATNSVGTTYTTVDTFTTIGFAPTVTSPMATNIALTTATLGGNVTSDGQVAITERGIVYALTSLNGNPQVGGVAVTQATTPGTTGSFTIDVSVIPTGTQISYAAYAKNAVGTSYSTVGTFKTQPAVGQFPGITVQILGGGPAAANPAGEAAAPPATPATPATPGTPGTPGTAADPSGAAEAAPATPAPDPAAPAPMVMIVTGTSQDDTIKVVADGSGGFIVSSNQLINGLPSPQTFTVANSFVANTLGGHDDLWLAAPLTFNGVTVDLGAGNDRLVLGADANNPINNNVLDPQFGTLGYLTVNGPLQVTGGEGNDRILERSTSVNGVKTIDLGEGNNEYNVYWGFSNETNFSSGAGNDNVFIGYLSSRQVSQFNTGAGNDLISYYASRFYKTAYLNSGSGADTVALDVNIYDDATTVDTGSEADYLLFSRSVAYKTVVLTTSGGADNVLVGKYISGLSSSGGAVYSNGGSNIDQLTLNTGDAVDSVQIAANVMRLFYANLGDAYDDADVAYNIFTDGLLDGGGQSTRLKLKGNVNLRTKNPG